MSNRFAVVSCGVAAILLAAGAAMAQGRDVDAEARTHFQNGIDLYGEEKYEQAAVEFNRAYELKPSFKILYNLAQAENELGHYAKALDAYVRYLAVGGTEIQKERVDQVKVEIARLNTLVGMMTVKGGPFGSTVFVDDERKGDTPLSGTVFVDLGEHLVVVRKDGEEIYREKLKVAGGQKVEVVVETGRKAAPEPLPESTSPPGPSPTGRGGMAPGTSERGEVSSGNRVWTWVAFGVGGAGAVAAAITGGLALSKASDVKGQCDNGVCPVSAKDDADTANALGWATNGLIGLAAVGIGTGVLLWFYEPEWTADGGASVAPAATADGAGIVVEGRF
jgi:hypothetical protein